MCAQTFDKNAFLEEVKEEEEGEEKEGKAEKVGGGGNEEGERRASGDSSPYQTMLSALHMPKGGKGEGEKEEKDDSESKSVEATQESGGDRTACGGDGGRVAKETLVPTPVAAKPGDKNGCCVALFPQVREMIGKTTKTPLPSPTKKPAPTSQETLSLSVAQVQQELMSQVLPMVGGDAQLTEKMTATIGQLPIDTQRMLLHRPRSSVPF